ncbi:MAG: hypothetical protein V5A62_08405 [Haloarculaceae archaeon]
MRRLTVRILGETLPNEDLRGQEDVMIEAADALVDRTNFRRSGQLLPDWTPTPTDRRFRRTVQRLDALVDGFVDERRIELTDANDAVCAVLLAAYREGDLDVTADGPLTFVPSVQLRPATNVTADARRQ